MKSIINTLLLIGAVYVVLVMTGVISEDELFDILGEVKEGETTQIFNEGEFKIAFDLIVGKVEVNDTSRTSYDRNVVWCEPGYIVHTTNAEIQYQVLTDSSTYYVDVNKKEYYISDDLGVTYVETSKKQDMFIEESNCVKKRNITPDNINSSKRKAEAAFIDAIKKSPKIIEAHKEFELVKARIIQQFEEAGFTKVLPPNAEQPILD